MSGRQAGTLEQTASCVRERFLASLFEASLPNLGYGPDTVIVTILDSFKGLHGIFAHSERLHAFFEVADSAGQNTVFDATNTVPDLPEGHVLLVRNKLIWKQDLILEDIDVVVEHVG